MYHRAPIFLPSIRVSELLEQQRWTLWGLTLEDAAIELSEDEYIFSSAYARHGDVAGELAGACRYSQTHDGLSKRGAL